MDSALVAVFLSIMENFIIEFYLLLIFEILRGNPEEI